MIDKEKGFTKLHSFLGVSDFDYSEKQSTKNERKYIKYRWLNNITHNQFTKAYSKVLPRNTIVSINNTMKKMNQTHDVQKILNKKSIEHIKKKTVTDVKRLEGITGWDLSEWKSYG
jgi:hypothetical protein